LVRNAELREAIKQRLYAFAPQDINIFAMVAQYTAYTRGEYWLDELREYINGNLDVVQQIFARDPRFKLVKSQGTYLQFVDCTALGMDEAALENFLVEKCGVYPSMGGSFGAPGCIRINVAMPRADVTAAIERIVEAAAEIQ